MGNFLKALNFSILFLSFALTLQSTGLDVFSEALFTPFGVVFFFVAFWNEVNLIYF